MLNLFFIDKNHLPRVTVIIIIIIIIIVIVIVVVIIITIIIIIVIIIVIITITLGDHSGYSPRLWPPTSWVTTYMWCAPVINEKLHQGLSKGQYTPWVD